MFLNVTTLEATPDTDEIHRLDYRIEGLDVSRIIGRSVFISFWVKTNKTGIYSLALNNADANRFDLRTYLEALSRRLEVMDSTAISLCMDNQLPILVIPMWEPESLVLAVQGKEVGTIIS